MGTATGPAALGVAGTMVQAMMVVARQETSARVAVATEAATPEVQAAVAAATRATESWGVAVASEAAATVASSQRFACPRFA